MEPAGLVSVAVRPGARAGCTKGPGEPSTPHVAQRFHAATDGTIVRDVGTSAATFRTDAGVANPVSQYTLDAQADMHYLTARIPPPDAGGGAVRCFDLYSGCGGLSLGLAEACRAIGTRLVPVAALDRSEHALGVYGRNFPEARLVRGDASRLLAAWDATTSRREAALVGAAADIDWLVAGPPCQGYSSLNHRTRGSDPRNGLYEGVARAARLLGPQHVLIENVVSVRADSSEAVARTVEELLQVGYTVREGVVDLVRLGVPQLRRRHVVVGTRGSRVPEIEAMVAALTVPARTVQWAIGDLRRLPRGRRGEFDRASRASADNERRMAYLRRHRAFDLPNSERPPCQRQDGHTFVSMYGRLRWDSPAQTVTSGYGSMGQGRYVHPDGHRTLTPHEAARLQFFPDWFDFGPGTRTQWADAIGNAAPMKLAYAVALWLMT